eukprot:1082537-Prymnesium_polylepis.1
MAQRVRHPPDSAHVCLSHVAFTLTHSEHKSCPLQSGSQPFHVRRSDRARTSDFFVRLLSDFCPTGQ